ncbi:haloacid dehalogenase superfamily protein, subfamily IA, variant 3 with third motif having DD or ED [Idiomarina sp. A28L]|uniref:GMP/IMP nucleotidase n=1 Tax=Idiomarina sp. A28L TaxID=1036674 RepID=UPI0002138A52|nr:GMP/IMP nucleotidase [Idiomarina sp. A28L]EGN74546.1 haloacid dehalogenase superfamily protein, subfamily IA, variant 3 with third motif having DD or ED [Idiomarina sp. A28L]
MLDWSAIDTVLLDMDGTLLDLRYDNNFWNEQLKFHYANSENISVEEAHERISAEFKKVAGTLNWYCLDYWEQKLSLPIRELKAKTAELIVFRPDTTEFLNALQRANKQVAIITNAHPDALALKNQHVPLEALCPQQFSTHQFGYCKEFQELWQNLQAEFPFNSERTLFVDDGEHILDSAKEFGIRYTLGIANPDSGQPPRNFQRHPQISSFAELPKLG